MASNTHFINIKLKNKINRKYKIFNNSLKQINTIKLLNLIRYKLIYI